MTSRAEQNLRSITAYQTDYAARAMDVRNNGRLFTNGMLGKLFMPTQVANMNPECYVILNHHWDIEPKSALSRALSFFATLIVSEDQVEAMHRGEVVLLQGARGYAACDEDYRSPLNLFFRTVQGSLNVHAEMRDSDMEQDLAMDLFTARMTQYLFSQVVRKRMGEIWFSGTVHIHPARGIAAWESNPHMVDMLLWNQLVYVFGQFDNDVVTEFCEKSANIENLFDKFTLIRMLAESFAYSLRKGLRYDNQSVA